MFSIRLFPHFHVRNGIAALFEVSDLRNGIFGVVIDHGDRNHRRQATRNTAGIEKVKAYMIALVVDDRALMPRINRRTDRVGLGAIGGMANNVVKTAVRSERPDVQLSHGVAEAIAVITRPMRVAGIGRLRHPYADEAGAY